MASEITAAYILLILHYSNSQFFFVYRMSQLFWLRLAKSFNKR